MSWDGAGRLRLGSARASGSESLWVGERTDPTMGERGMERNGQAAFLGGRKVSFERGADISFQRAGFFLRDRCGSVRDLLDSSFAASRLRGRFCGDAGEGGVFRGNKKGHRSAPFHNNQ